ncbi:hypothetical protein [Actinokineospora sp. UTMC 2448]|uniref:hypothetical protein n=1 Tax=Actinokineospora sp. UTMC 2448 TaxID=2268449 RepID=UPI0021643DBB|nr:hypothetical protein [Actinokineospora sp. UTMC 2448]
MTEVTTEHGMEFPEDLKKGRDREQAALESDEDPIPQDEDEQDDAEQKGEQ